MDIGLFKSLLVVAHTPPKGAWVFDAHAHRTAQINWARVLSAQWDWFGNGLDGWGGDKGQGTRGGMDDYE